jgi:hypothetical protein
MLYGASELNPLERLRQRKMDVGKPEGKRPIGRPRCKWEDNN